ncbi:MAG: alpha/beta hydrolase [Ilumatobacteraceae bacterium]|nr:alpha/beta hydrolase [Acidimicrobiales bacterium]MCB9396066.1 alpha/beta hydrolase [Acidimicrobiaceae bacterium]
MGTLTSAEASAAFRRDPDRWIDVGAGSVGYRRFGSGPDVLFVHGWPVHSATFRTLLPALADHVTCHLFDFPGTGGSRFDDSTTLTIRQHVETVRRVLDELALTSVVVVAHDSGGLIARHALAGDRRVRAWCLLDTEQSSGLSWRFKSFIMARKLPGLAAGLGWVSGRPRLRRMRSVFGGAFADRSLLEGEFDEFFLQPLHRDRAKRAAAAKLLASFDTRLVDELVDVHRRIEVPVQLVWGEHDAFFPLAAAEREVSTFPNAQLHVVRGAGLFVHEERPSEVAEVIRRVATT